MTEAEAYLAARFDQVEYKAMLYVQGWKKASPDLSGTKIAAERAISGFASRFDDIDDIDDAEEALACAIAYKRVHGNFGPGYVRILRSAVEEIDDATGEPLGTVASFLEKAAEIWN